MFKLNEKVKFNKKWTFVEYGELNEDEKIRLEEYAYMVEKLANKNIYFFNENVECRYIGENLQGWPIINVNGVMIDVIGDGLMKIV